MAIFELLTPVTYWLLIAIWGVILILYFRRLRNSSGIGTALELLLWVLLIDAFRTLFESLFFGAWYTSRVGLLPSVIHDLLVQPQLVFIPKAVNLVAAFLVLFLLLRHMLPSLSREQEEQRRKLAVLEREIAERRQAEAALEALNHRHELILNAAADGIFGVDAFGRVTFINPSACALMGYDEADLIGEHHHAKVHGHYPDGRRYPKEECPVTATLRAGTVHKGVRETFWRKDGSAFEVELDAAPIREAGTIVGAVVIFRERRDVDGRDG